MTSPNSIRLARVLVTGLSPREAIDWIVAKARLRAPADVHLVNAYNVVLSSENEEYGQTLSSASLNLPDGRSIVAASWWLAKPMEQVRGPSLFAKALEHTHMRHFLLGGTPSTLAALTESISIRYPAANVVGGYSPPFAPIDVDEVNRQAELVSAAGADVVWLGLGTPKQDYLAPILAAKLNRPVVCVGAAFDFLAGTQREAPIFLSRLGVEWLFRLISEPRRLWRRYLLGNPKFIRIVVAERFPKKKAKS